MATLWPGFAGAIRAWERVARGLPMAGVAILRILLTIGQAIHELEIIALAGNPDDFRDQVTYLPIQQGQHQVSEDKRSGIRSDPNRADDPEYIVRLVGQVVRVSVETVRTVAALPAQFSP